MNTLTLSRFAKTLTGTNSSPANAALAPVAAAMATQAPAPVAKPVEVAKAPAPAAVQVETTKVAATIAPATATQPKKVDDMGKIDDVKAKREKLMAELAALDKDYEALRSEERAGVLAKVREMMAEWNFTPNELLGRTPAQRRAGKGIPTGKVAAKYKDPKTGATWSGRGRKAAWLEAALKGGAKLEDFAV